MKQKTKNFQISFFSKAIITFFIFLMTLPIFAIDNFAGNALYFGGTVDDYLINDEITLFDEVTFSCWMKSSKTGENTIFDFASEDEGLNDAFKLWTDNGQLKVRVEGVTVVANNNVTDGKWHHLQISFEKSSDSFPYYNINIKIYVDELLVHEETQANTTHHINPAYSGHFVIGQETDSPGGDFDSSQAFAGELDEIIYRYGIYAPNDIHEVSTGLSTAEYTLFYLQLNGNSDTIVEDCATHELDFDKNGCEIVSSFAPFGNFYIDEYTVWGSSTYMAGRVRSNIVIADGGTLQIEPGTDMLFETNSTILIDGGALIAEATPNNPIQFMPRSSNDNNAWGGIKIIEPTEETLLILDKCVFRNSKNIGEGFYSKGGAIFFRNNIHENQIQITNSQFINCEASALGGAIYSWDGKAKIYNNYFYGNQAEEGGAIYILDGNGIDICNNIIYGNSADSHSQIAVSGNTEVKYNLIQGGFGAVSDYNFDANPLITGSMEFPTGLIQSSPCINAGKPNFTHFDESDTDFNGNDRTFQSPHDLSEIINQNLTRIDVGPFEYSAETFFISNTTIDQDFYSNESINIPAGGNLYFSPGVEVSFADEKGFFVQGNIIAEGTPANQITFTADNSDNGWFGFIMDGSNSSSYFKNCIIEYGTKIETDVAEGRGGNFRLNNGAYVYFENCILQNGNAEENGGAIFSYSSDFTMANCLINDNSATSGGAIYVRNSSPHLYNTTIVGNSTPEGSGAIRNYLDSEITLTNCILWDNGVEQITDKRTDTHDPVFENCVIEGGYFLATNSTVEDPLFVNAENGNYTPTSSFVANMGKTDSWVIDIPETDLANNPRIFEHNATTPDKIDIGAYEIQAIPRPLNLTASDGDNNYQGYVQIEWTYNSQYSPFDSYQIYRNGEYLNEVTSINTKSYSDYTAVPGEIYSYEVRISVGSQVSEFSDADTGYLKPNGTITGNITTSNNNPVVNVRVSIDPSPGSCIQMDGDSQIIIEDPQMSQTDDFTFEIWLKTNLVNQTVFSQGIMNLQINNSGYAQFNYGSSSLTQPNTFNAITDNEWHHISVVHQQDNSTLKMYIDETEVLSESGFDTSEELSGDIHFQAFNGYIDDLRYWEIARDSILIVDGKDIIVQWNEEGLRGYWPFNENTGDVVFDATNNANNGELSNCDWNESIAPDMLYGAFTDNWGDYSISLIPYGSSTTFEVTPYKENHIFQPESRQITLSESNIAVNDVNFTDNSMIPISGRITFAGTDCPVENVVMQLNGTEAIPYILTDEDGYYTMEVEHGTECIIAPSLSGHTFTDPINLGSVVSPQTGVDFEDTKTTSFRLEVLGGKDRYPLGDFDVMVSSVNGAITDSISGENWITGAIDVTNLPPMKYNVRVEAAGPDPFDLAINDLFNSTNTDSIDLTFSEPFADTLTFIWNAPMQMEVVWFDTLGVEMEPTSYSHAFCDTVDGASPDSLFFVVKQNKWYEIELRAFEDYSISTPGSRLTYLDDADINIVDEIGTTGELETSFADSITYVHRFAPFIPNLTSGGTRPYQNPITFTISDDKERAVQITNYALIEGDRPLENTFATSTPEIPFLILHDPPGDGSSTTFNETSSHTTSWSMSVATDQSLSTYMTLMLGPDVTIVSGTPFVSKETTAETTLDLGLGLTVTSSQENAWERQFTFSSSEEYSTSAEDQVIGRGSDLYVGGAMNLILGATKKVRWNSETQSAILDDNMMINTDGFATTYIYTENQIINTVIPTLEAINDTVSAALWQGFVDQNQTNIENAVENENHPGNISFNSGAGYMYSEETTSTQSYSFNFDLGISTEFSFVAGAVVDGIGFETGTSLSMGMTIGTGVSTESEQTTAVSYTLADDDETSDLNELADYFSVDVKKDPIYGTPVFDLVSGASSAPWEENTRPRDGVSLNINPPSVNNVEEGNIVAFTLTLGNESQTDEDRRYYLTLHHETNPNGAVVKINGVTLSGAMAFDVPANTAVNAVMTVEQGPFAYEYDDIMLEFYAEGDRGNECTTDSTHFFHVEKSFDVTWETPYSKVTLESPEENWIVNQANDNTLNVMLSDYDVDKYNFKSLKFEYKHPEDENWLPAFEVPKADLIPENESYIVVPWDISLIPDGNYDLRAAATDSLKSPFYTPKVTGVIDRQSPEVLGNPEPADGILANGDEISVEFTEFIDPATIAPHNASMRIIDTDTEIDFEISGYENKIELVPSIANYWFENSTISVEVDNLKDIYGNPIEETVSWEFYANSNPVSWNVSKLDVIKPLGESMILTANLVNEGGSNYNYVITDDPTQNYSPDLQHQCPDWLSVSPYQGQLIPLDQNEIQFEINEQIGFGHYETTLYAHTSMGNEEIEIEVDVLANPPEWTFNDFVNFQSSMTIIGELNIDDEISADANDVIGAFVENENGDYECRGVANIESVSSISEHQNQFFLTIYSDNNDVSREVDDIIFRIWDNSSNKEYFGVDQGSAFGSQLSFVANSVIGNPIAPIELIPLGTLVQDIPLNSGWTWFSSNINLEEGGVNDVLANLNPSLGDIIKNSYSFDNYDGSNWIGSLTNLNNTSMYKIYLENEQNLEIVGDLCLTNETSIPYSQGWNWISYIPNVSMSINEAMSQRTNTSGDFIKNQLGYSFYVNEEIGWLGSLRFMNPGEGFMLKSLGEGSSSFVYPDYNDVILASTSPSNNELLSAQNLRNNAKLHISNQSHEFIPITLRDTPEWNCNPRNYEFSANITAEIRQSDLPVDSGNYLLAAFVDDECRGTATGIAYNDTWLYFLTVFANSADEEIEFRTYSADSDEIIDSETTFIFSNDLILGNPIDPFGVDIGELGALAKPENVRISITDETVTISWNAVSGANSYKIYSSSTADGEFIEIASMIPNTSWSEPVNSERKFYYVVASTEISERPDKLISKP